MSPEDLATRLGLSGMTLRRWKNEDQNRPLPRIYRKAYVDAVYDLILEGRLSSESDSAKNIFKKDVRKPFWFVLRN